MRGWKASLRGLAERLTGTHIFRSLPRGVDVFNDVATAMPTYRIDVVFDVGANVGQSAQSYIARFPSARVWCFEPVAETFRELASNTRGHHQIRCFQVALGSRRRQGRVLSEGTSTMNRLLDEHELHASHGGTPVGDVEIRTLDEVCESEGIERISYLKIDTEGGDLEVLRGAGSMLAGQRVDLVEVEAGMNPFNKRHAPLEALKSCLEQHGYVLFGLYEQVDEWPTGERHLRRSNAVFMSRRMVEAHRRRP